MAGVTRNLRLILEDNLTASARFNLERIDQLGSVFPLNTSSTQSINSEGDIRLDADNGNGTVFAPTLQLSGSLILESTEHTFSLQTATQTENLSFTLPGNYGDSGQFLQTSGSGTLTWEDPPSSNFSSLNDTLFTNLQTGEFVQFDGTRWINTTIPNARQTTVVDWLVIEGNTKTITHGWGTTNIQVWIYEPGSSSQVFVESVDYVDNDTILLTALASPDLDYRVHLIQTL